MSAPKKLKISDLSGLESGITLNQLQKCRSSLTVAEVPGSDPAPDDELVDQLNTIIATFESQINDPLSLSFSASDDNALERFNIVQVDMLYLQPKATLRQEIITSRNVSDDKLWSNDNMYKHLSFLASSFTNRNKTSSRLIIDTFFFRSTAMVLSSQKVIVMLENRVRLRPSQMDTISGVIDYTAIVVESSIAESYIHMPPTITRCYGDEMIAFFAAEVKAIIIAPIST